MFTSPATSMYLGPQGKAIQSAERLLVSFLTKRGGSVEVASLSPLFDQTPWLKRAIGNLGQFCNASSKLTFNPAQRTLHLHMSECPNAGSQEPSMVVRKIRVFFSTRTNQRHDARQFQSHIRHHLESYTKLLESARCRYKLRPTWLRAAARSREQGLPEEQEEEQEEDEDADRPKRARVQNKWKPDPIRFESLEHQFHATVPICWKRYGGSKQRMPIPGTQPLQTVPYTDEPLYDKSGGPWPGRSMNFISRPLLSP